MADVTALADTSLFIAVERHRRLSQQLPERLSVSIITLGELRLGVLAAAAADVRARRLETLSRVEMLDPIPIDRRVASAWAALRLALRDQSKRMPLNDSWIAATAIAHRLPVVTQDDDYDGVPNLVVIRV
ncbi:MAG: PIN domain-containing protein [Candidatus Dormibacteraeota bacterium]|nr:PIN domain-containing protein [Candidatus Dormibacteraeota bacterium]MBV9526205.1 PIN domain-containing protein [Candidatus Dormibacteraeota bacterium]